MFTSPDLQRKAMKTFWGGTLELEWIRTQFESSTTSGGTLRSDSEESRARKNCPGKPESPGARKSMQLGTTVIPVAGPASIKVQHPSSLQLHKEHRERQLFPPHSHLLLRWSQTFIPQENRRNNSGSRLGTQPECVRWSVWRLCAELWYVSVPVCESECMFSYFIMSLDTVAGGIHGSRSICSHRYM